MYEGDDLRHCQQLVEIVKTLLQTKAETLVRSSTPHPVLIAYSSDATSYKCRAVLSSKPKEGMTGQVRGSVLSEFLLQRVFLKTRGSNGDLTMAVLLPEPVQLKLGKKAHHLFDAACKCFPMGRMMGHKGITILHLSFDRAIHSALVRLFRQRQRCFYSPEHRAYSTETAEELILLDWITDSGCALHDCQNSFKWALFPWTSASIIDDLHIAIESLRNSLPHLVAQLSRFLVSCVAFEEKGGQSDDVSEFWRLLGVDAEMLDTYCELISN
jgi:hypothetical protein